MPRSRDSPGEPSDSKGRLSRVADLAGVTELAYDAWGRVVIEQRTNSAAMRGVTVTFAASTTRDFFSTSHDFFRDQPQPCARPADNRDDAGAVR